jgi:hypothetical protein
MKILSVNPAAKVFKESESERGQEIFPKIPDSILECLCERVQETS